MQVNFELLANKNIKVFPVSTYQVRAHLLTPRTNTVCSQQLFPVQAFPAVLVRDKERGVHTGKNPIVTLLLVDQLAAAVLLTAISAAVPAATGCGHIAHFGTMQQH